MSGHRPRSGRGISSYKMLFRGQNVGAVRVRMCAYHSRISYWLMHTNKSQKGRFHTRNNESVRIWSSTDLIGEKCSQKFPSSNYHCFWQKIIVLMQFGPAMYLTFMHKTKS